MIMQLQLATAGFLVSFKLTPLPATREYVDVIMWLVFDPSSNLLPIQSVPRVMSRFDFEQLGMYFEQHVHAIQRDPQQESAPFTPTQLGFQVRAASGEIRSAADGSFTAQVLLNVGRAGQDETTVYAGGETVVYLDDLNRFLATMRIMLRQMHDAPLH
jgi:hypothetical protein